MPKVSVIMPVYNTKEEYLREAIESILNQTFSDFEFLIIDDASTNGGLSILRVYEQQDKRVRIIENSKNRGVSAARNIGLDKASGEYILFVDSDDVCHPNLIEVLYKNILSSQADVSGCVLGSFRHHPKAMRPISLERVTIYSSPLDAFFHKRFVGSEVCGRLYKKSILSDICFLEGVRYEDVYFTSLVMDKSQSMVVVNKQMYFYRKHNGSFMRGEFRLENATYYLKVIQKIYDYFKAQNITRLPEVRKYILNKRIKMIFNKSVRQQKSFEEQKRIFDYLQENLKALYGQGVINYQGLKLKHKISLWLLLNREDYQLSLKWTNFFKEI